MASRLFISQPAKSLSKFSLSETDEGSIRAGRSRLSRTFSHIFIIYLRRVLKLFFNICLVQSHHGLPCVLNGENCRLKAKEIIKKFQTFSLMVFQLATKIFKNFSTKLKKMSKKKLQVAFFRWLKISNEFQFEIFNHRTRATLCFFDIFLCLNQKIFCQKSAKLGQKFWA